MLNSLRFLVFFGVVLLTGCNATSLATNPLDGIKYQQLNISPNTLRIELLKGQTVDKIQDLQPEFSWRLANKPEFSAQTAYQIQVINTTQRFDESTFEPVWDSGKVTSSQSVAVSYGGMNLKKLAMYQWRVRVWSKDVLADEHFVSAWSTPQQFIMASAASPLASKLDIQTTANSPIKVTTLSSGRLLLDFGKVAFGYLELGLTSDKAGEIIIHFGERGNAHGEKQGIITNLPPRSSVRYYQVPITVNAGADMYAVHPPRDKRNTKGEAIAIPGRFGRVAPFRFIEIDAQGLNLSDIQAQQVMLHYPFDEQQANFTSSSSLLDEIWQLCKYSIKATSFAGVYVDGDRERIPYEADAYINQLSHYLVDDEYSLARHSHEYLMANPTWPTEWKQHSIMMAWTDWMYTGDIESMAEFYQQLKTEKTLEQYQGEHGLLVTYPKRNRDKQMGDIVDWPPKERDNYQLMPINTVVNSFYYLNLTQMAAMAKALGFENDYQYYSFKARQVAQQINTLLFDQKTGLYVDGLGTQHSAVHANILPLAVGIVPQDKRDKILTFIKSKGMAVSVYFAQYLLEALYLHGEADYGLSLLTSKAQRSWYNMLQQGSTITMEAWDDTFKPNQDWNHAWGAVPGNIIGRYILGVRPKTAGFAELVIAPQPSQLTQVSGKVPTIRGPVQVDIRQIIGQELQLSLSIPGNTKADVILPLPTDKKVTAVLVNDVSVGYQQIDNRVILPAIYAGQHRIKLTY